jgi:hypothetical protein
MAFNLDLNSLNVDKLNTEEPIKKDVKTFQNELQNNDSTNEVVADKSVKVTDTTNIVTVFDFILANENKLNKCAIVTSVFENAKQKEYILFRTIEEEKQSNIFLFDGCSEMYLKNFIPDKITVQISGMIIESSIQKVFVSKTNVFQFELTNNIPIILYKYKRCSKINKLTCETEKSNKKSMSLDIVKLKIRQVCPRLFNTIKELNSKEEIKNSLIEFIKDIVDLNYLIKIYKDLLLNVDL